LLSKLIKYLIFAMNFDDKVPEHIIEEIFRQKKGKNKSGSVAYGGDALTNTLHVVEPEIKTKIESEADYGTGTGTEYGTITEFNAEVDKKIKGIQFQDEKYKGFRIGESFFSEIIGYADIKRILIRCIQSSEPMHNIFDGPPASPSLCSYYKCKRNWKIRITWIVPMHLDQEW
jgi:hypothetical protein